MIIALTAVLLMVLAGSSLESRPSRAQEDVTPTPTTDFPVSIQVSGLVKSVTKAEIVLDDGTTIKISLKTKGPLSLLQPSVGITVIAEFEGDDLTAVSISITPSSTEAPETPEPSSTSTLSPTRSPASTEKAPATSDAAPLGKDKGKDKSSPKDAKSQAKCLKKAKAPTSTRLGTAFDVPASEIVAWHCQGYGFGEITRAYVLARKTSMTVEQIFALRTAGKSWAQIASDAGLNPVELLSNVPVKGKKDNGGKTK